MHLTFACQNRKVVVIKNEAERVRTIFQRYLELGSLNLLMQDLRHQYPLVGRPIGYRHFLRSKSALELEQFNFMLPKFFDPYQSQ